MNPRAAAIVAAMLVFAVALFSALYFTLRDDGSSSGGFTEFTAEASISPEDGNTYTARIYSKVTLGDDGVTVTQWDMRAVVEYVDTSTNQQFRHVYANGHFFYGEVESNGFFNVSSCDNIETDTFLDAQGSFVPQQLDLDSRTYNQSCAECTVWRLLISTEQFIMEELDGVPKFLSSRDQLITVSRFEFGLASFWNDPVLDPNWDVLCVGNTSEVNLTNANTQQSLPVSVETKTMVVQPRTEPVQKSKAVEIADWREHAHNVHKRRNPGQPHILGRPLNFVDDTEENNKHIHGDEEPAAYCPSHWKGDGWCDRCLNNAGNNYDNGDCCQGTCSTGRRYRCGIAGYDCKSMTTSRTCLFVHGVGGTGPNVWQNSNVPSSCSTGRCFYWGNFPSQVNGYCDTYEYMNYDTNSFNGRWDNVNLQNAVYSKAKSVVDAGGNVIAHSMGNMILAGACLRDSSKCGVQWIALGGPIGGAKPADSVFLWILQRIVPSSYGSAYSSLRRTYNYLINDPNSGRRYDLARTVKDRNLYRCAACGRSAYGAGGVAGLGLKAIATVVWGYRCTRWAWIFCTRWSPYPTDGMVHFDECARGPAGTFGGFSTNWRSRWFNYDGNHNDLTGVPGNHRGFYDFIRNCLANY